MIEPKITVNSLDKYVKSNEFFFSKKDYNNDLLDYEISKKSKYINEDYNLKDPVKLSKRIINQLKNYPDYVTKFFKNSTIEPANNKNYLENLKGWMDYKDDVDFKTILTDKYKSYKDKSITKVKKFFNKINMYSDKIIDDDTIDEFIKQYDEVNYNITPLDLSILEGSKILKGKIGFILITNKYSEKHDCYIYGKEEDDNQFIVLYQHDKNGDKTDYELCCIKVNDKCINSYSDLKANQNGNNGNKGKLNLCIKDK